MIYCEKTKQFFTEEEFFNEVWKDIIGYEGQYQISNLGRAKSLERIVKFGNRERVVKEIIISRLVRENKYCVVTLVKNNISIPFLVHRLVATAFYGVCPDGKECCHDDGNRQNNRLENLKWGTHIENMKDRIKHGTLQYGINNPACKYSEEKINEVRKLFDETKSYETVYKCLGISKTHVWNIINNKRREHII